MAYAVTVVNSFNPMMTLSDLSGGLGRALTDNRHILSLLRRAPLIRRVPKSISARRDASRAFAKTGTRGMAFTCGIDRARASAVLSRCSLALRPKRVANVRKTDNSNGSALLGLLVHF